MRHFKELCIIPIIIETILVADKRFTKDLHGENWIFIIRYTTVRIYALSLSLSLSLSLTYSPARTRHSKIFGSVYLLWIHEAKNKNFFFIFYKFYHDNSFSFSIFLSFHLTIFLFFFFFNFSFLFFSLSLSLSLPLSLSLSLHCLTQSFPNRTSRQFSVSQMTSK